VGHWRVMERVGAWRWANKEALSWNTQWACCACYCGVVCEVHKQHADVSGALDRVLLHHM
jgi:hypothetical protein